MKKMYLNACYGLVVALVAGVVFSSCSKSDDPEGTEIVKDVEAYFVTGIVTDLDGKVLAGVKVEAGDKTEITDEEGSFVLEIGKKDVELSLSAEGFLGEKKQVAFAEDAHPKSSIYVPVMLAKEGEKRAVKAEDGDEFTVPALTDVTFSIPAGALKKDEEIIITPLAPDKGTTVDDFSSFLTLSCEPSMEFNEEVTLKVVNPIPEDGPIFALKHLKQGADGSWVEEGQVDYADGEYFVDVTSFSNHTFALQANDGGKVPGVGQIATQEINNIGQSKATATTITVPQKFGSEFSVTVIGFGGNVAGVSSLLFSTASLLTGSVNTVVTKSIQLPFNVSGDTKFIVSITPIVTTQVITFPLVGGAGLIIVTVTTYAGSNVSVETISGGQHSGGSGK
jgi:hypothetical protein